MKPDVSRTSSAAGDARHASPDTHLAHHFDAPSQQFTAGKLGMWLFIATELLMFGGLFCTYAVFRSSHPAIFEYGSAFLDTTWGAINTIVLILSSFTMALAVRAAQCNQRRQLVLFLSLTLICGVDFLVVKYIEYSHKFHEHLVWGEAFYQGDHVAGHAAEAEELVPGDSEKGRESFAATCAACHGPEGRGLPNLGPDLVASQFVGEQDDQGLLGFLQIGRSATDPRNTTGLPMPARGGNPLLGDQDLLDIIAHVRVLRGEGAAPAGGAASEDVLANLVRFPDAGRDDTDPDIFHSVIPLAAAPPSGLAPAAVAETPPALQAGLSPPLPPIEPPENAHLFFAIYFCMTGLHGIHVLVGIGFIAWLRKRALRGDFSSAYFTPVDFGGLYWHVVDIIWIFLFPLLYLI